MKFVFYAVDFGLSLERFPPNIIAYDGLAWRYNERTTHGAYAQPAAKYTPVRDPVTVDGVFYPVVPHRSHDELIVLLEEPTVV